MSKIKNGTMKMPAFAAKKREALAEEDPFENHTLSDSAGLTLRCFFF